MSSQFIMSNTSMTLLQSIGPLYLKLIGFDEQTSVILFALCIIIGIIAAVIMNVSKRVFLMNKICLLSFGFGGLILSLSYIVHLYHVP